MKYYQRFQPSNPKCLFVLFAFLTLTGCSLEESLPGYEALTSEAGLTQGGATGEKPISKPDKRRNPDPPPRPEPTPGPKPKPKPKPKPEPDPAPDANSPAQIGGVDAGAVTEDTDPDLDGLLEVAGKLDISDIDAGESAFRASTSNSAIGALSIDVAGNWSYSASNNQAAIQALAAGKSQIDIIQVSSVDGTTHNITILISGTDDAAVISGDSKGSLTEDFDPDGDNLLELAGSLSITDIDNGESAFAAGAHDGRFGRLTIDTAGRWSYAADNGQASIQALAGGSKVTDTLQVSSVGGTTHSVVITIEGTDDATTISGDVTGSVTEDVDPDGDGLLEVGGKLNVTSNDAGQSAFVSGTRSGSYGSLNINARGDWGYAAKNRLAAIQALAGGNTLKDTIRVSSVDGTTRNVVITINGADDATVIGGVNTGSVTEDADPDRDNLLEVSGKLTISDPDSGEAVFVSETKTGSYGNLTIDTAGAWNYAADNGRASIQALAGGSKVTDTLKVSSVGGATHNVVITINGADDPTVISGVKTGSVTEDVDPDGDGLLEVTGVLSVTDNDAGESAFVARTRNGSYGSLTISAAGNWRYAADNDQTAIQSLASGSAITDTLQVSSVDGTTKNIIITINGADDATVIGGVNTGSVTEDVDPDGDNLLEVDGKLTITAGDSGMAAFVEATVSGAYGSLSIDTAGDWRYAADNGQAAIQSLADGGKITDTVRVSSVNGTTKNIFITINGADDATVIGGVNVGSVTEDVDPDGDGLLEVAGKLTISDADTGDAAFINASKEGLYGNFAVDAAGNWSYAVSNNLASIQNLDTGATLTDSLTVRSVSGVTRDVLIAIAGVDETSGSGDINVSWIAPTEREDGTSISMSEIAGYRVYYGTAEGDYTDQVEVAGGSTMQVTLPNLVSGTYYIVVTTYDTDGRESAYSQMVTRRI
jgi:VCBS repeat-containing protein